MTGLQWTGAIYAAASALALLLYGADKGAAAGGGRRVPESILHLVELAGGWPGALLASALFRHKSRKASFRIVRGLVIALHLAAWAAYVTGFPRGALAPR